MSNTLSITVSSCEQCPFYARGAISMIADALAKDQRKTGLCEYNARTTNVPKIFGLSHIAEPSAAPPATCPLRTHAVLIALASGK